MATIPDTGEQILTDLVALMQNLSVRSEPMSEIEGRILLRDLDTIPGDHNRYMCWGMYYALKKDKTQSIQYHQSSLREDFSDDAFSNFIGSLYLLGDWKQALSVAKQWLDVAQNSNSGLSVVNAVFYAVKGLYNNGKYLEAQSLLSTTPLLGDTPEQIWLIESVSDLNNILGKGLAKDYYKLHQAFIDHSLAQNLQLLPCIEVTGVQTDEDEFLSVLETFKSLNYQDLGAHEVVSSFIMESPVIDQVSSEVLKKISFSIESAH